MEASDIPGLSSAGVPSIWTLSKPIEKVILDNEEKSTTYAETGGTGLLLGTVKLPAPKNHFTAASYLASSVEVNSDVADYVIIRYSLFDGATTPWYVDFPLISPTYKFWTPMAGIYPNETISEKGNQNLELRIYLIGDGGHPDVRVYCRNLVVTVVPFYES